MARVDDEGMVMADGSSIEADLVIWATGATAPPEMKRFDLPTNEAGFFSTQSTLQSTGRPNCFVVGDTGTMIDQATPKAGVYAVRQGPILWENLNRLFGERPLIEYQPQRSFLKLINTGDGRAIGGWKGLSFSGNWVKRLKDRIDTRFMEMYQVADAAVQADEAMQCRGCGCKLGAEALNLALAAVGDDQIELEDAAVISESEGETLIASTDFFSSPFTDAYLTGRISAIHCASDIVASGGTVTHALGNVVLPEGDNATQQRMLADFIAGATREFTKVGGKIVGGHTIVGPRGEYGFTVVGRTDQPMLRKNQLAPGDTIYLTKPLGVGILLAAHMRSQCLADDYDDLIETMLIDQMPYAKLARSLNTSAMTDVTGFGLAGHLIEMLRESDLSGVMQLEAIPLLGGVDRCLKLGIESSLAPENRRFERWIECQPAIKSRVTYKTLFDPQTCGGLIFGVSELQRSDLESACQSAGIEPPIAIARVEAKRDDHVSLVIE